MTAARGQRTNYGVYFHISIVVGSAPTTDNCSSEPRTQTLLRGTHWHGRSDGSMKMTASEPVFLSARSCCATDKPVDADVQHILSCALVKLCKHFVNILFAILQPWFNLKSQKGTHKKFLFLYLIPWTFSLGPFWNLLNFCHYFYFIITARILYIVFKYFLQISFTQYELLYALFYFKFS